MKVHYYHVRQTLLFTTRILSIYGKGEEAQATWEINGCNENKACRILAPTNEELAGKQLHLITKIMLGNIIY